MSCAQRAALVFGIAMLAVSGCGSSSKTGSTSTSTKVASASTATSPGPSTTTTAQPTQSKTASGAPLSRAELIAKGDAICTQLNAQMAANVVDKTNGFASVLPQAAAFEHAEYLQLAGLVPPSSMAREWHSFLSETERWSSNTAALGATARAGHFSAGSPLATATTRIHTNLIEIAKRNGFKQCSEVE